MQSEPKIISETSGSSTSLEQEYDVKTNENKYLKLSWAISLVEAKLGLKPSIANAKSSAQFASLSSLFSPGECKDINNDPTREELMNKLEELKIKQTLGKITMLKKELRKGVKTACVSEIQRLSKQMKRLKSNKPHEENSDASSIEKELSLTKSLDVEVFTDQLVSHTILKAKPLREHPHLECYNSRDRASLACAFSSAEQGTDDDSVDKITQRLRSSKSLSLCVATFKSSILVLLGLKKDFEQKKKSKGDGDEKCESFPKKIKSDGKTANDKKGANKKAESMFVTSLGKFDEEDEEFKKLYGITGKNRPGQRHRRKMYEEKFGEEAKHLKTKSETKPESFKESSHGKPKAEPEEKLHPSWEAKRKQNLSINLSAAPKNKNKIVFD